MYIHVGLGLCESSQKFKSILCNKCVYIYTYTHIYIYIYVYIGKALMSDFLACGIGTLQKRKGILCNVGCKRNRTLTMYTTTNNMPTAAKPEEVCLDRNLASVLK